MSSPLSDWNTTPFRLQGRPLVWLKRAGLEELDDVLEYMDCATRILEKPLHSVFYEPQRRLRRIVDEPKWRFVSEPIWVSMDERVANYLRTLREILSHAIQRCDDAALLSKYEIWGACGGFGDPPPDLVLGIKSLPSVADKLTIIHAELRQLCRRATKRENLTGFALFVLNQHYPGEFFQSRSIDERRYLSLLAREDPPLVERCLRTSECQLWSVIPPSPEDADVIRVS